MAQDIDTLFSKVSSDEAIVIKDCCIISRRMIPSTGKLVFCKKAGDIRNKIATEKIHAELNELQQHSHPCLPTIIPIKDDCVVSLINSNQKLLDFIQCKILETLDYATKFKILLGIASGLKFLHEKQLVHYDLNPKNILLDDNTEPILTNWWIPNLAHSVWQAPEHKYEGNSKISEKANIFSFGQIALLIASNELPVPAEDSLDQIVFDNQFDCLKSLIEKCRLQKPDDRPDLQYIWQELLYTCINPSSTENSISVDIENSVQDEINQNIISSNMTDTNTNEDDSRNSNSTNQIQRTLRNSDPADQQVKVETQKNYHIIDSRIIDYLNRIEINKLHHRNLPQTIPKQFIQEDGSTILQCITDNVGQNDNIVLIFVNGFSGNGKTSFVESITKSELYVKGNGMGPQTKGVIIDGPYKRKDLVDKVFDSNYQQKLNEIELQTDPVFFFLDSEGFKNKPGLDSEQFNRILSSLFSISTISVTLCDAKTNEINMLLQILRKGPAMSPNNSLKSILMLISGSDDFDKINSNFECIDSYQKQFCAKFVDGHPEFSKLYQNDQIIACPIGNIKHSHEKYFKSVWYALYQILRKIQTEETKLLTKKKLADLVRETRESFFPKQYQTLYKQIMDISAKRSAFIFYRLGSSLSHIRDPLICCQNSFVAFRNLIIENSELYERKLNENEALSVKSDIEELFDIIYKNILPSFLASYEIPIRDVWQYALLTHDDVKIWRDKIIHEIEKNKTYPCIQIAEDKCQEFSFPFKRDNHSKPNRSEDDEFAISFFPFIWEKLQSKTYQSQKLYEKNLDPNCPIFVFIEQKNQPQSTILFESLTGIPLPHGNSTKLELYFEYVEIKNMINRFGKYKEHLVTELMHTKQAYATFVYFKGICSNELSIFSRKHQKASKVFYVSSLMESSINIKDPDPLLKENTSNFFLFWISKNLFKESVVNRETYTGFFRDQQRETAHIRSQLDASNITILPIHSDDYNFAASGPMCWESLKLGCLYILKETEIINQIGSLSDPAGNEM